jgi:hypothetical protein
MIHPRKVKTRPTRAASLSAGRRFPLQLGLVESNSRPEELFQNALNAG